MRKQIVILLSLCLLGACASFGVKQVPSEARGHKRVDYFSAGQERVAFKAIAQLDDGYLSGVLRIKKIGPQDYDVLLMGEGAYKYLEAVVSPSGVAYKYIFKDADTSLARSRVEQFLRLLLDEPGTFASYRVKDGMEVLTYKTRDGKTRLTYPQGAQFPSSASSSTLLNTAEVTYEQYTPYGTEGDLEIPHLLVYKDGNITLDLELISIK